MSIEKISEEEKLCLEEIFNWEIFQDFTAPHFSFDENIIKSLFNRNLLVRSKDLSTQILNSFDFYEIPPYLLTEEAIILIFD